MKPSKKPKTGAKIFFIVLIAILIVGGYFGLKFYTLYFAPNVTASAKYLYIKTGDKFEDVLKTIDINQDLKKMESFKEAAIKMGLNKKVKPGRYLLKQGMTNRSLINMLKAGNQEPVKLKIQNIRKKENFAAYLGKNLEQDSVAFINYLDSAGVAEQYGFDGETLYTMFIPNTYEFYWNTSVEEFVKKMNAEYLKFWNEQRLTKAKAINLSPAQVTTLASIVDSEALMDKEMPTIAGLYLNRLRKGILLQADPTVIFANNDFTVRRVTGLLLRKESKYNTYKYAGLPPGPITMPSIKAIDAVLNSEKNNYIYMCAKEDFSGYHNFAETKAQHEINARKYRAALDKRNIYR